MDDSFDNEYELVRSLPSERVFCMIMSYAYNYHLAVAKFQQLGKEALKFLNKSASGELEELCVKDPDIVTMFKMIGTMKGLGLRKDTVRFDIEFPTRNHLKVFLARMIVKRRRQLEKGLCDLHLQNSTAIISSTDYCDDNVVSHLCKNIFTPRQGSGGHHESTGINEAARPSVTNNNTANYGSGGFS